MEFYSETHITARKEHVCELCGEIIHIGEAYWRESGKFEGDFFSRCLHEHCHEMEREYCEEVDTEFSWDCITDHVADKHCISCEHSGTRDDEEGWTDCPYTSVTECKKIKDIYNKPEK